jgi:CRISPR-associated endonuclease/helicase Cas3
MALPANLLMLQVVNNFTEPFVDLICPVRGHNFPADHNYGLPSACFGIVPEVRQHPEIGILSIPGIPDRRGKILLTSQSCLRIRLPVSKIPLVYGLAGKKLTVGGHEIHIGIPSIAVLQPFPTLRARIVTIKGKEYMKPSGFLAAAQGQLDDLGIKGQASIPLNRDGEPSRKTIKIKRFTIVGFTTEVSGLNEEDSLKLQYYGIGGRRHLGAGIFLPVR